MADENYTVAIDLVSRGKPLNVQSPPVLQKQGGKKSSAMQGIIAGVISSVLAKGLINIRPFRGKKSSPVKKQTDENKEYIERIEKSNQKLEDELRKKQDEYFARGQLEQSRRSWKYIREMEKENDKLINEAGKIKIEKFPKKKLGVQNAKVFTTAEQITVDRRIMTQKKELRADLKASVKKLDATQNMLKETQQENKILKDNLKMERIETTGKISALEKELAHIQRKDDVEKLNRSVGQQVRRQRESIQMGNNPKPIEIKEKVDINNPRLSKQSAFEMMEKQKLDEANVKAILSGGNPSEKMVSKPTQTEPRKSKKFEAEEATEEEIDMEDFIFPEGSIKLIEKLKKKQRALVTIDD